MLDRRRFLTSTIGSAAAAASGMPASAAAAVDGLQSLARSPRMPVLFIGHGSPMNAIRDNPWRRSWQALGAEFGTRYPRPNLVLCVSAHWITTGWWVTGMAKPRTIHDFGGFPQELFDQQYPALGAPAFAKELSAKVRNPAVGVDPREWGYDHGTWSVLQSLFPKADIPVVQLSLDYSRPPAEHFALARQLKKLRDHGVLVVGSGNVVHNLRASRRDVPGDQAYDWAIEFDRKVAGWIERRDDKALTGFLAEGDLARLAHPSHDHLLPLLHAAAVTDDSEAPRFFNLGFQSASISMRSVAWG